MRFMTDLFQSAPLLVRIALILPCLLEVLFYCFMLSRLFRRAGEKMWKAFIPGYNLYNLWKIGWTGKRFFQAFAVVFFSAYLLDILTYFGDKAVLIGKIILYCALAFAAAFAVLDGIHFAHRFNKSTLFGVVSRCTLPVAVLFEVVTEILGIHLFGMYIEYIFFALILLVPPIVCFMYLVMSQADYSYNRDTAGQPPAQFTNYRITTIRERRAMTGYAFIIPFVIGFLLFMVKPLIFSMQMSLNEVTLKAGGGFTMTPALRDYQVFIKIGGWTVFDRIVQLPLNNYHSALAVDPNFNQYLTTEIGRMVINTIATLIMSFVIAVILNQKFKGRLLCRVIFFLPVILSSGVLPGIESSNEFYNMMTDISNSVQNSSGVNISQSLQNLLSVSGVASQVFNVIFQMIDAIYDIVMASGIQIIVFLSGLQAISPSLYEAADVEGCSAWESFWKITFPMVSPLLLVNCIYTIIDFFMKNDNRVIERINNIMYGVKLDFGQASAMSWIYFGVALAFIGISSLIITWTVKLYE